MPRQNRVTPLGEMIATPARGTLFGNRGCLHDSQGQIKRLYQVRRWIYCQLDLRQGRSPRPPMPPGGYTGLFFLDETTALAAGHRPCAECKRPRFKEFVSTWLQANPHLATGPDIRVDELDAILQQERLAGGKKLTYTASLAGLPPGTMILLDLEGKPLPYLVLAEALRPWTPEGYGPSISKPSGQTVQVLTPRSVVETIGLGFQPGWHASALE